jgi:hypothetical protein
MGLDIIRRASNLVFSIAQCLTPVLPALGFGINVGARPDVSKTLIQPAAYAFSIWGVIFALFLVYGIYQFLPSQKNNKLFKKIGWLTALVFLGDSIWVLIAQANGSEYILLGVIILMVILSYFAYFRLVNQKLTRFENFFAGIPLGMITAWLTAATLISILGVMNKLGLVGLSLEISFILIAGIIGLTTVFASRNKFVSLFYVLTLVWALVGIAIENGKHPVSAVSVLALAVLIEVWFLSPKKIIENHKN